MNVVPDYTLDGSAEKTPQLSYKPHDEDSFHSSEENQPVVEEQTVEYSKRTSSKEVSCFLLLVLPPKYPLAIN